MSSRQVQRWLDELEQRLDEVGERPAHDPDEAAVAWWECMAACRDVFNVFFERSLTGEAENEDRRSLAYCDSKSPEHQESVRFVRAAANEHIKFRALWCAIRAVIDARDPLEIEQAREQFNAAWDMPDGYPDSVTQAGVNLRAYHLPPIFTPTDSTAQTFTVIPEYQRWIDMHMTMNFTSRTLPDDFEL